MQPFPYPSDATHKIWSRLANWLQRYSSLKVWTTTDNDGGPLVYYKLTLSAFGSGELIKLNKQNFDVIQIKMLLLRVIRKKKKKKKKKKHIFFFFFF